MTALLAVMSVFVAEPLVSARALSPARATEWASIPYAIEIVPEKGWHLYWKNPGDSGIPPSVKWELPDGWKADELQFPAPHRIVTADQVSYGYEGTFGLIGAIIPPKDAKPGEYSIPGKLSWMACQESCIMGSTDLNLKIRIGIAENDAAAKEKFDALAKAIPSKKLDASAFFGKGTYRLVIPSREETNSYYFYCETEGVVTHQKDQLGLFVGKFGCTLQIPKSDFATEPAKRLKGILHVTGPNGPENYIVDTSVKSEDSP